MGAQGRTIAAHGRPMDVPWQNYMYGRSRHIMRDPRAFSHGFQRRSGGHPWLTYVQLKDLYGQPTAGPCQTHGRPMRDQSMTVNRNAADIHPPSVEHPWEPVRDERSPMHGPTHPTVGVAVVGLTNNVPARLSSRGKELPVSHWSSNFTSTMYIFTS